MFSSVCHFSPCFIINIFFLSILLGWRLFFLSISGGIFSIGYCFYFSVLGVDFSELCFPLRIRKYPPGRRRILHILFCVLVSITVPIVGVFDRYLGLDYWNICFLALETKMIKMPFFSHCHFTTATMRYMPHEHGPSAKCWSHKNWLKPCKARVRDT